MHKLLSPGGGEEEADRDRGAGDQEEGEGVDSHGKISCIWEVSKLWWKSVPPEQNSKSYSTRNQGFLEWKYCQSKFLVIPGQTPSRGRRIQSADNCWGSEVTSLLSISTSHYQNLSPGLKLLRLPELMVKRSAWSVLLKQEQPRQLAGFHIHWAGCWSYSWKLLSGPRPSGWGWRPAPTSSTEMPPFSLLCLRLFLRLRQRSDKHYWWGKCYAMSFFRCLHLLPRLTRLCWLEEATTPHMWDFDKLMLGFEMALTICVICRRWTSWWAHCPQQFRLWLESIWLGWELILSCAFNTKSKSRRTYTWD